MESIWESVKTNLKEKISELNFNNWIKPITEVRQDDNRFVIKVPNRFVADWITDYYLDVLEEEVATHCNQSLPIFFEVEEGSDLEKEFGEIITDKAEVSENLSKAKESVEALQPPKQFSINAKYSFDTFVVGGGNQLAYAASRAIAELPGGHYNPLFLYGGVGLGKTHLLHAVSSEARKRRPNIRIIYSSSEKFMNELINSIRYERMASFRQKYRDHCDILLIDDIQFIAGKERTQEEFFHTFNTLYECQKQIVVTSDKTPKEIPGLEERLRSRFEWGLIADVQPPDLETRVAILRKQAEEEGIFVPDDVTMFIASNIKSNVRELEGALIRLHAFAKLKNFPLNLDLAKEVLKDVFQMSGIGKIVTIEVIQKIVATYYQVKIDDLKSQRRFKGVVKPRQVAMYLCKKHLDVSFPEIGTKFGGKDHTTVMHACQKIAHLTQDDLGLKEEIETIEQKII